MMRKTFIPYFPRFFAENYYLIGKTG
jgi:hypothetical protein